MQLLFCDTTRQAKNTRSVLHHIEMSNCNRQKTIFPTECYGYDKTNFSVHAPFDSRHYFTTVEALLSTKR
jgi:hypothetical protein